MTARRRSRRTSSGSRGAPAGRPGSVAGVSGRAGRRGWYPLAIFGIALAIRLVHVWQLRSAPFFGLTMGDAQSYHAWGLEILAGDWLGSEIFYQAPLYPYFLGAVYALFGADLLAVRVVQSVLGAASCALLAVAAGRLFSRSAGIAAGLMLAVYAPAIFFDGLLQKAGPGLFLLCVVLVLLSRLVMRPAPARAWIWPGVALGALLLTREHALVFVVAVLGWLAVSGGEGRARLARAGALVLGLALVILPVAARNAVVGGEFVLTTAQFGPNFYIGNNPGADGTYRPLVFGRGDPRFERQDATQVAEREAGAALTPAQVSRYWTRRALEYIRTEPGDWLRLTGRKVVLASNAAEVADTEDQLSHADWSIPLRVAGHLWHFGILAPLAAAGLWLTWRRRRQLLVLQLMLAAYAASVVLFAVMGRYRYPLVPLLILFAAAAVVELRRMAGSGWERRALGAGVAAAGMLVFCNWPVLSMDDMRAVTALNVGTELQARGRLDDAAGQYRQVLALAPDDALAHSNLGTALAALGRPAEAIGHYERALALAPDDADSHSNLGNALVALDRTDQAIASYRRALALDPSSAEAHAALGMALHGQGRLDDAVTHLRRALDLGPAAAETLNILGVVLASEERLDEAAVEFRRALAIDPDFRDAHANLAMAGQLQGRPEQAVFHYRELARLDPGSPVVHNELGLLLAANGELATAVDHLRQAVALDPAFAFAHANLGTALQMQGNPREALDHYREAQRIDPAAEGLQARIDAALAEIGRR